MNIQALYHKGESNYAYAYDKDRLHLRLRTAKDDMSEVIVHYGCKFRWAENTSIKMNKVWNDTYFDYYFCEIISEDTRFGYYFELLDNEGERQYMTEVGMLDKFDDDLAYCTFFQYPYINETDVMHIPDWYVDSVFYQIFVERFCNGDEHNSPPNLTDWYENPKPKSFYGGDLRGIIKNLDYISELGINAIYLTPVFEANSNHKYDIKDYMKVDSYFGDKDTLSELVAKAHERGIRIVLDAVFNHCSKEISFFQDVLEKQENSEYKDWFIIESFPVNVEEKNYETFSFVRYMPKFNTANPKVQEYLLSVAEYWTNETHIDGWRLDVADEVTHEFWRRFRKKIKSIDKELVLIGEAWHYSFRWLSGDMFDSVMNYPVNKLALDFFARRNIDAKQFSERLVTNLIQYYKQVNLGLLNLLDSHDTERFLTTSKGDVRALYGAAAFLFSYVGVPCTYYGTEIGMDGVYDPGCRKGFDWRKDHWNNELRDYYKKLIDIRKNEKALRRGDISFFSTSNAYIIKRTIDDENIFIIINGTQDVLIINVSELTDMKSCNFKVLIDSCANAFCDGEKVYAKLDNYGVIFIKEQ